MTAEVAILNGVAVALAADSAVTISAGNEPPKIYNSVNKLFGLSRYHPVGIMIFGSAEICGVPWEPIIKLYRRNIAARTFRTIEEYARSFISFLKSRTTELFPRASQERFVYRTLCTAFGSLREEIVEGFQNRLRTATSTGAMNPAGFVQAAAHDAISEALRQMEGAPFMVGRDERDARRIRRTYAKLIEKARDETLTVIPGVGLTPDDEKALVKLSGWLISKLHAAAEMTGVVIAGFGESEIFPALRSFEIAGIENNDVLFSDSQQASIRPDNRAAILAFAQRDMVVTFMDGIEPQHRRHLHNSLGDLLVNQYPQIVEAAVASCGGVVDADALRKRLETDGANALKQFDVGFQRFVRQRVNRPIIGSVAHLPKDELASLAESLVNLTSLRRHVSPDPDTVGGPVDVAVISKGDGFIWMRRKHYFRGELNPHFMAGYHRDEDSDELVPQVSRAKVRGPNARGRTRSHGGK
jgi:hypothetical protein